MFSSCWWVVTRRCRRPVRGVLHSSWFILPVITVLPSSRLTYLVKSTHRHTDTAAGICKLAIQAVALSDLSSTNNFLFLPLCSLLTFLSLSMFLLLLSLCVSRFLLVCLCCFPLWFYTYLLYSRWSPAPELSSEYDGTFKKNITICFCSS